MKFTRREKTAIAVAEALLILTLGLGQDRFNWLLLALFFIVTALAVYYVVTDPERRA